MSENIAVIGAGLIGRAWSIVFARAGREVALYDLDPRDVEEEPAEAFEVRAKLNERIRTWIDGQFDGLSATQVLQWRAIVVEERFNISLSPWKESNIY